MTNKQKFCIIGRMRIEIINGSVEYDGNTVLSEINFSVSDKEKSRLSAGTVLENQHIEVH